MHKTQTPWTASGYNVRNGAGKLIFRAIATGTSDRNEAKANTRHVVKCVNAHDDLATSVTLLLAFAAVISPQKVDAKINEMLTHARAVLARIGAA